MSKLLRLQKGLLTGSTSLKEQAEACARDATLSALFQMPQEDLIMVATAMEKKLKQQDPDRVLLEGGADGWLDRVFKHNTTPLRAGEVCAQINNGREPMKTCKKRPEDCRWIQKGESYTDEEGKEQTAGKKGICIPTVAQYPVLVAEHKRSQLTVFAILLVIIFGLMFISGFTFMDYFDFLNNQFEQKVELEKNQWFMGVGGTVGTIGAGLIVLFPPAGLLATGAAVSATGVGAYLSGSYARNLNSDICGKCNVSP